MNSQQNHGNLSGGSRYTGTLSSLVQVRRLPHSVEVAERYISSVCAHDGASRTYGREEVTADDVDLLRSRFLKPGITTLGCTDDCGRILGTIAVSGNESISIAALTCSDIAPPSIRPLLLEYALREATQHAECVGVLAEVPGTDPLTRELCQRIGFHESQLHSQDGAVLYLASHALGHAIEMLSDPL